MTTTELIIGHYQDVLPLMPAWAANLVGTGPLYPEQMDNCQRVGKWLRCFGKVVRQLRLVLASSTIAALSVACKRTDNVSHDKHLWAGLTSTLVAAELQCFNVNVWHKASGAQY